MHKVADERINEDCLDDADDNDRKKEKYEEKSKQLRKNEPLFLKNIYVIANITWPK